MNAERLYARMKQVGLDAIVATMPENVTYSSGFWAMSQWIRRGPQAYVLTPLPDVGEPAIIASTGIIDLATDDDVWIKDVRRYGHFAIDQVPDIEVSAHDARIASVLKHPDDSDAITSLVRAIKDRKLESVVYRCRRNRHPSSVLGQARGRATRCEIRASSRCLPLRPSYQDAGGSPAAEDIGADR